LQLADGVGCPEMKQTMKQQSLAEAVGQLVVRASYWKQQRHLISALVVVTSREEDMGRGLDHLQKLAATFEGSGLSLFSFVGSSVLRRV